MGGIEADRAAHSVFAGLFHDDIRHRIAHHLAELEMSVYNGGGGSFLHNLNLRTGDDLPHLHLIQVLGNADHAVGIVTDEIRHDKLFCHKRRFLCVKSAFQQDLFGILFQVFMVDSHIPPLLFV